MVTKISGVEDFLIDPDQLATNLKSLLAGSSTVDEAVGGGARRYDVFVQVGFNCSCS